MAGPTVVKLEVFVCTGLSLLLSSIFLSIAVLCSLQINVKKIAFGNEEHITDQKMGVSILLRLFISSDEVVEPGVSTNQTGSNT